MNFIKCERKYFLPLFNFIFKYTVSATNFVVTGLYVLRINIKVNEMYEWHGTRTQCKYDGVYLEYIFTFLIHLSIVLLWLRKTFKTGVFLHLYGRCLQHVTKFTHCVHSAVCPVLRNLAKTLQFMQNIRPALDCALSWGY